MSDEWIDNAPPRARRNGAYSQQQEPAKPEPLKEPGRKKKRGSARFQGFMSSAAFIDGMKPPEYLIPGIMLRGYTYFLTGITGHGKTMVALYIAITVALGRYFGGSRPCIKGKVIFIAAENPENVRIQFYSMCADMGVDPDKLDIVWHVGRFDIEQYKAEAKAAIAANPDAVLCMYDSLQALFPGDDENSNTQMLDTIVEIRALTEGHPNRPSNLIICHPVKNARRDNLIPRGGGSALNECDGNLTAWMESDIIELGTQGKFRGKPFDPVSFEKIVINPPGLIDSYGEQMPGPAVRMIGEARQAEIAREADERETAILALIGGGDVITSIREIAAKTGISKSAVSRHLKALTEAKAIKRRRRQYVLTPEGEKWL